MVQIFLSAIVRFPSGQTDFFLPSAFFMYIFTLFHSLKGRFYKSKEVLMNSRTYYDILGVSREATLQEITSAKNALAKVYHPDANMNQGIDTTACMQEILEDRVIMMLTGAASIRDVLLFPQLKRKDS